MYNNIETLFNCTYVIKDQLFIHYIYTWNIREI